MKVITQPTVYLIGRQTVDGNALDRFLVDHEAGGWESDSEVGAEVLAEVGGRLCYMSYAKPRPGGNAAYLHHIKEVGHGSVLEHAVFNLVITGVSRSLTHELVRHRAGFAYSQLSQRYVDESVAEYVVPHDLLEEMAEFQPSADGCLVVEYTDGMRAFATWKDAIERCHQAYRELSDYLAAKAAKRGLEKTEARKFARQAARSVLPNATEAKIAVTANARALRHFLEQRGGRHAEPEIRKLANALLDILQAETPNLFSDYQRTPLPDGTAELTTPYGKV